VLLVIPARGGSKRLKDKALKELAGKPLLVWAIDRAKASGFEFVVATESDRLIAVATVDGAPTWKRDLSTATDDAPDYSWAKELPERYPGHDAFCILRITSPFFSAKYARQQVSRLTPAFTSIRAATPVSSHPAKMWTHYGGGIYMPILAGHHDDGTPWHSSPTQTLLAVHHQTAGCEVVWAETLRQGSLAGDRVGLYIVDGPAALDLNTPEDWAQAEEIAKTWTP